jgi:hypothetical protein
LAPPAADGVEGVEEVGMEYERSRTSVLIPWWLVILALLAVWAMAGCALRPLAPPAAPVLHARVVKQAIDCKACELHAVRDCEDNGGWSGRSVVVEYLDYSKPYEAFNRASCENECMDGVVMSHTCKREPGDWRVAEVR